MLQPRTERELSFLGISSPQPRTLLYDTTVYIDILQGRFPEAQETILRAAEAFHSTVAESELASACALLDPALGNTRNVIKQVIEIVDRFLDIGLLLRAAAGGKRGDQRGHAEPAKEGEQTHRATLERNVDAPVIAQLDGGRASRRDRQSLASCSPS